jgi:probable rRNA maturation factor
MPVFLADEQSEPVDSDRLIAVATFTLAAMRVPDEMECAVLLVDTDTISQLNHDHMGHDGPTDVLAFPIDEPGESVAGPPAILGDVVLCPAVAATQADAHGHTADDELAMLTVHGILHLLGWDHRDAAEETAMFGRTAELLAAFAAKTEVNEP